MPKIRCLNPNHEDLSPSMEVYKDSCFCFVCGYSCGLDGVPYEIKEKASKKEPENIEEKISEIKTFPVSSVRGLFLHRSYEGFYIIWPEGKYYKLRRDDDRPRYVGPRGHRAPIFWIKAKQPNNKVCVICEGELNALSLEMAFPDHSFHIVSPGSANELARHFEFYLQFSKIYVIVDRDAAGVYNGLRLKEQLVKKGRRVVLIALERDFNDILQTDGTTGIKETLKKELGFGEGIPKI